MITLRSLFCLLAVVTSALLGCRDEPRTGPRPDSGTRRVDAGRSDAGGGFDAGGMDDDAGASDDAGGMDDDAGASDDATVADTGAADTGSSFPERDLGMAAGRAVATGSPAA